MTFNTKKTTPLPANPKTACIFMANTLLNDYMQDQAALVLLRKLIPQ